MNYIKTIIHRLVLFIIFIFRLYLYIRYSHTIICITNKFYIIAIDFFIIYKIIYYIVYIFIFLKIEVNLYQLFSSICTKDRETHVKFSKITLRQYVKLLHFPSLVISCTALKRKRFQSSTFTQLVMWKYRTLIC